MKHRVTDFLVYRYRYILGYACIALLIASVIFGAGLMIPGGLRQAELQSAADSANLSPKHFTPQMVVDLPYHALQRISMKLFGLTNLGIKAPSMLLAGLTSIGLVILFRSWFRHNAAIIAIVLTISLPGFMFVAQDGTSLSYYLAVSVWLLVAATFVLWYRRPHLLWKIVLFGLAALSLYTPLGLCLIVALLCMTFIHPHARILVRSWSIPKLSAAFGVFVVAVSPLIYASLLDRHIWRALIGIPEHIDWLANLATASKTLFGFWLPASGELISPLYPMGFTILMLIGVYRLFQVRYTVRSYLTWAWALLMAPFILMNPQYAPLTVVIASLFAVRGMAYLIIHWYQMFPRNPYARIAGLLPLALLVLSIGFSNINRYTYGYAYTPDVASYFTRDLTLVNAELASLKGSPATIVVAPEERDVYDTVARYHNQVAITTEPPAATPATLIVSRAAHNRQVAAAESGASPSINAEAQQSAATLSRILTSSRSTSADRFYIYQK